MKKLVVTLSSLLLAACSASSTIKNVAPHSEVITTSTGSHFNLIYGYGELGRELQGNNKLKEHFRVIHKSHAVGKAAFQGVVGGIFCNPLSLLSCSWRDLGFSREEVEGDITNIPNIVNTYAIPKYIALLKDKLNLSKPSEYPAIYFYTGDNFLVYDDDGYRLRVGFQIIPMYSRLESGFKCMEEKKGIPYEKWAENNYALAISEGKALIDKCFERLDSRHLENLRDILEKNRAFNLTL